MSLAELIPAGWVPAHVVGTELVRPATLAVVVGALALFYALVLLGRLYCFLFVRRFPYVCREQLFDGPTRGLWASLEEIALEREARLLVHVPLGEVVLPRRGLSASRRRFAEREARGRRVDFVLADLSGRPLLAVFIERATAGQAFAAKALRRAKLPVVLLPPGTHARREVEAALRPHWR